MKKMEIEAAILRHPKEENKYMILLKNDRIAITVKEIFNSIALAAMEIKDLGHTLNLDISFSVVATQEEPKKDNLIILSGDKNES